MEKLEIELLHLPLMAWWGLTSSAILTSPQCTFGSLEIYSIACLGGTEKGLKMLARKNANCFILSIKLSGITFPVLTIAIP